MLFTMASEDTNREDILSPHVSTSEYIESFTFHPLNILSPLRFMSPDVSTSKYILTFQPLNIMSPLRFMSPDVSTSEYIESRRFNL